MKQQRKKVLKKGLPPWNMARMLALLAAALVA